MMATPTRQCSFILNQERLPSPFLMELSRRRKTKSHHLLIYGDDMKHCPIAMTEVLESMLFDDQLFKLHQKEVKEAMLTAIEDSNRHGLSSRSKLRAIAIESIVKEHIAGHVSHARATQYGKKFELQIFSSWKKLREKRLENERHLTISFVNDCRRSKSELNYVLCDLK
jgi:hypothetical protein